jgi:hypothetical protein
MSVTLPLACSVIRWRNLATVLAERTGVNINELGGSLNSLRDAAVAQSLCVFVGQRATQRTKVVHRLQMSTHRHAKPRLTMTE